MSEPHLERFICSPTPLHDFCTVFQPFIDRFSPFFPFSETVLYSLAGRYCFAHFPLDRQPTVIKNVRHLGGVA
jgi:hypothetical protein